MVKLRLATRIGNEMTFRPSPRRTLAATTHLSAALALVAVLAGAGCTTQYDRDIADCSGDKSCIQETKDYYRKLYDRPAVAPNPVFGTVPQLGREMMTGGQPRRPVLSCYNNGGIVNCY